MFCCDLLAFNLDELPVFSGAMLTQEEVATIPAPYRLILGALEKVNNEIAPERAESFQATRRNRTYLLPDARQVQDVATFYRELLSSVGQTIYECKGRDCGSSSYWANRVFDRAILYGPEQYQQYFAIKLTDQTGYLVIYIGERATRKIYLYVEHIQTIAATSGHRIDEILGALRSNGRYVFPLPVFGQYPAELVSLMQNVVQKFNTPVVVVAHDKLRNGEGIDVAISRTRAGAQALKLAIAANPQVTQRIIARGAARLRLRKPMV